MDPIPSDLAQAAAAARDRLSDLARSAATANAAPRRAAVQGSMAAAAREAIFLDALAAAMHARLEEFKTVVK